MFLPSSNNPVLRVGIYRTSSIGDVVLATACIDMLNKFDMPVEVTWIGREPSLGLLKAAFPNIKTVEFQNTEKITTITKQLSEVHFLIDLQTSLRSKSVCKVLKSQYGIPSYTCEKSQLYRIKLLAEARFFGRSRTLPVKNLEPVLPQYQMMCNTLIKAIKKQLPTESLDILSNYNPKPILPTEHDKNDAAWLKELRFNKWLAIAPGAAHPTKRAPVNVFVDIIKLTIEKLKKQNQSLSFGILLVGNNEDRTFGVEVLEKLSWSNPSLNLAGNLTLWETSLALKNANVLLSNDSSLGHIAEAVNTNTAILFGPTIEGFGFGPRKKESKAFSSLIGCRPCSKHGKASCRFKDKKCFTNLPNTKIADYLVQQFVNSTES